VHLLHYWLKKEATIVLSASRFATCFFQIHTIPVQNMGRTKRKRNKKNSNLIPERLDSEIEFVKLFQWMGKL